MGKGAMYFDVARLVNSEVPYLQAWSVTETIEQRIDVSEFILV